MNEETFRKQQPFAGQKKPSMLRRAVWNDYTNRQIYMITMVTEGRQPLFGEVIGRSDAPKGAPDAPAIRLTDLGFRVEQEWWACADHHSEITVVALQIMPDHLHGILFVKEKMEKPLGMAIRGFKQSCNRHYRQLVLGLPPVVQYVALATQHTGQQGETSAGQQGEPSAGQQGEPSAGQQEQKRDRRGEDRTHGMLFARGYNDRLLLRHGQIDHWLNYLADNPRRLLMKREHPDLFRVQHNLIVGPYTFTAIGNRFLLDRPELVQVQCSRSLTPAQIEAKKEECLGACRRGAVLVSPSISQGEKVIMRAAFDEGFPVVYLQENGFTDLAKPGGQRMEACAEGRLLILAPWEHHNEQTTISRTQCLTLNEIARTICSK